MRGTFASLPEVAGAAAAGGHPTGTTASSLLRWEDLMMAIWVDTDFPAYSDTVYSDIPLTVTLMACP